MMAGITGEDGRFDFDELEDRLTRSAARANDDTFSSNTLVALIGQSRYARELEKALEEVFRWLDVGRWTLGRRAEHRPMQTTDLRTMEERTDCRCGQPWPCAFIQAWELLYRDEQELPLKEDA